MKDINLIRKIAWSFHQTTGIDYQELFSEASHSYSEVLKDQLKPGLDNDTKFSYWAWVRMENDLINFIRREKYHKRLPLETEEVIRQAVCFQTLPFQDFFEDLSPECKQIALTTFQIIEELTDPKPKLVRGQVFRQLRKEGWTWERIWDGFREMKNTLAYN